ncbi:MAG TPA: hypothetical protein VFB34_08550 [Chloroflexota bacterium]|nr:hypothetical protein [Chloroflexota bacterium]
MVILPWLGLDSHNRWTAIRGPRHRFGACAGFPRSEKFLSSDARQGSPPFEITAEAEVQALLSDPGPAVDVDPPTYREAEFGRRGSEPRQHLLERAVQLVEVCLFFKQGVEVADDQEIPPPEGRDDQLIPPPLDQLPPPGPPN